MRLVHGVGINDVGYQVVTKKDGKRVYCPFYSTWRYMLKRCYSKNADTTYKDCYVCNEWLSLSNFKHWMELQIWRELQLDKDIIKPGNKVYCPEFCAFVPNYINSSIVDRRAARGSTPQGVYRCKGKDINPFQVQLSKNTVKTTIGYFATEDEAIKAYTTSKAEYLVELAEDQEDNRVANGLRLHAQLYLKGEKL